MLALWGHSLKLLNSCFQADVLVVKKLDPAFVLNAEAVGILITIGQRLMALASIHRFCTRQPHPRLSWLQKSRG